MIGRMALAGALALLAAGCAQGPGVGGDGAQLVTGTPTASPPARTRTAQAPTAPQLPKCERALGTLAINDQPIPALVDAGLGSPVPLLRVMIGQSNCFRIVEASHAGRTRTDYILTPEVLAQKQEGGHLAGGLGSLLPGNLGTIAGSITTHTAEAQTSLFLTKATTGVQIAATTGHAKAEDVGLALPGYAPVGGYGGDLGKAVSASFLDAYVKLVAQVQAAPSPRVASRR